MRFVKFDPLEKEPLTIALEILRKLAAQPGVNSVTRQRQKRHSQSLQKKTRAPLGMTDDNCLRPIPGLAAPGSCPTLSLIAGASLLPTLSLETATALKSTPKASHEPQPPAAGPPRIQGSGKVVMAARWRQSNGPVS